MEKVVFINAPVNVDVRNLLRSSFYKKVLKEKGTKFVFFVSSERFGDLKKEFNAPNIVFEISPDYTKYAPSWHHFWQIFVHDSVHTITIKTRQKYAYNRGGSFINFFIKRIAWFLGGFNLWRKFLRWFEFNLLREDKCWNEFFEKYKPNLVFAPALMIREDTILLKAAKRRKIPTVGMVRSWDNLTSKLFLSVFPNKLLVQSEAMKNDAVEVQDYPEDNITITGFLQWENYLDPNMYMSKEEFAKIFDLPSDIPWVTYFGGPPFTQVLEQNDYGDHIFMLKEAMNREELSKIQLIIKNHPIDKEKLQFRKEISDIPVMDFGKDFKFGTDTTKLLLNLIRHSDVIVNFATSVAVEAAILDVPIVTIGFNGYNDVKVPWEGRVDIAYDNTLHTKRMIDSGGVWRVSDERELVKAVNTYLKDRKLHKEGRRNLANIIAGPVDGMAGERVINTIVDTLNNF